MTKGVIVRVEGSVVDVAFEQGKLPRIREALTVRAGGRQLVMEAAEAGVPIISSMGAGNKLDPTAFQVADIYKTSVCPLAKVMRRELKKRGIKKLKVVYSREQPVVKNAVPASVAFVPSVVGLIIAGEVIKDLAKAD